MEKMSIIVRYCKIFAERKLKKHELSFAEQVILMYLAAHEYVNQEAIAKYYMIDKGMIAKTLDKLEKKEFIKREKNQENRRENIVSLSEKGEGILGEMSEILEEWNKIFYDGISESEKAEFKRISDKMAENAVVQEKNWEKFI